MNRLYKTRKGCHPDNLNLFVNLKSNTMKNVTKVAISVLSPNGVQKILIVVKAI